MISRNLNLLYILLAGKTIADRLGMEQPALVALVNDHCQRKTGHPTLTALQASDTPVEFVDQFTGDCISHIMHGNLHLLRPTPEPMPEVKPVPPKDSNDLRTIVREECDSLLKCMVVQHAHQMDELKDDLHRLISILVRAVQKDQQRIAQPTAIK